MDIKTIVILILSLLLIFSVAGLGFLYIEIQTGNPPLLAGSFEPTPNPNLPSDLAVTDISIFFLTRDYQMLKAETHQISQPGSMVERVEIALQELLQGPRSRDLLPTLPQGTEVQSIFWSEPDQLIAVSFSPDLLKLKGMHAIEEWAIIYSIVNTITAQSTAFDLKVQLLVDGQLVPPEQTLWDWTEPFTKEKTFLYQEVQG